MRRNIYVRYGKENDIPRCVEVCNNAWKGIYNITEEVLLSRFETFPEGFVIGEVDGQIEGYLSFQLIDEVRLYESWEKATDNGTMKNSHCPKGEWIMGVGLAVTPIGVSARLTPRIISFGAKYMIESKKRGAYFAVRLARYARFREAYSPEDYVIQRSGSGRSIDPEISLWERYGFSLVMPPIVFSDYVEGGGDPESLGYAVLIQRLNPFM